MQATRSSPTLCKTLAASQLDDTPGIIIIIIMGAVFFGFFPTKMVNSKQMLIRIMLMIR